MFQLDVSFKQERHASCNNTHTPGINWPFVADILFSEIVGASVVASDAGGMVTSKAEKVVQCDKKIKMK